ncbi:MAG: ATP-grasp domain-containing protein [Promethearchaeota archaeon]
MVKKILISAKSQDTIINRIIQILEKDRSINLIYHDPVKHSLNLEKIYAEFKDIDFIIVKGGNECSLDLLQFANLYNIPSLHDINTVLMCKNKVFLDNTLRKIFKENSHKIHDIFLPKSWIFSLLDVKNFKKWAENRLPIVLKSHYQHNENIRFNFLVKELSEIDLFCRRYKNFLYYDIYIQEFIECDEFDRKIYVIGDKVFGIKRENPIYIFLRERPETIDVSLIKREEFKVSKDIEKFAKFLSKNLNLKIFGFDLVKPIDKKGYYLIDLNDFPGFKGIKNVENILLSYILGLL